MLDPTSLGVNNNNSLQYQTTNIQINNNNNNVLHNSPRYAAATSAPMPPGLVTRYNSSPTNSNMPALIDNYAVAISNSSQGGTAGVSLANMTNGGGGVYYTTTTSNGLINNNSLPISLSSSSSSLTNSISTQNNTINLYGERHYGFGSVISRAVADDHDKVMQQNIERYIQGQNIFENDSDLYHRIEALTLLERVCKTWIMNVYQRFNTYTEQQIREVGGALFTFGSYRLGVHFRGGDIDTLLLAPRRVERDQFFTEMPQLLRELPECESVTAVPDAYAPIINIVLSGVEIDLLFCQCKIHDSVPSDLNVLGIDVQNFTATLKDLRSLNGCRVNEYVLSCVPNQETFRNALRAVKYWAKRRCIYSNVLGYFGGISWALLVAFTCQHYPYANAAMIVKKMFLVFSEWDWPQPVFVRDPRDMEEVSGDINVNVWDARQSAADRLQLMPIITPVYPQQNTTYNVHRFQYMVLLSEISRGYEICEKIWKKELAWEKLFEPLVFFTYRSYLVVEAQSDTEEIFKSYCGFVESRLRKLVELVSLLPELGSCRPHPRQFSVAHAAKPAAQWLFGLDFRRDPVTAKLQPLNSKNFAEVRSKFTSDINLETQQRAQWDDGSVRTEVKYVLRKDLVNLLPEEVIGEYEDLRRYAEAIRNRSSLSKTAGTANSSSGSRLSSTTTTPVLPTRTRTISTMVASPATTATTTTTTTTASASPRLSMSSSTGALNSAAVAASAAEHATPVASSSASTSLLFGDTSDTSLLLLDNNSMYDNSLKRSLSSDDTTPLNESVSAVDADHNKVDAVETDINSDEHQQQARKRLRVSGPSVVVVDKGSVEAGTSEAAAVADTSLTAEQSAAVDLKIMEEDNMDRRHMADIDKRDLLTQQQQVDDRPPASSSEPSSTQPPPLSPSAAVPATTTDADNVT